MLKRKVSITNLPENMLHDWWVYTSLGFKNSLSQLLGLRGSQPSWVLLDWGTLKYWVINENNVPQKLFNCSKIIENDDHFNNECNEFLRVESCCFFLNDNKNITLLLVLGSLNNDCVWNMKIDFILFSWRLLWKILLSFWHMLLQYQWVINISCS